MAQGHRKYRPTHPRSLGVIGEDKTPVSPGREVMDSKRITGVVFLFEEVEKHRKVFLEKKLSWNSKQAWKQLPLAPQKNRPSFIATAYRVRDIRQLLVQLLKLLDDSKVLLLQSLQSSTVTRSTTTKRLGKESSLLAKERE
ncbi:hypothetical protein K0M31_010693 [Melipona bicolor]|uniref:Uncharacterized protein n=1 Tax=Melipona bicolor TaxID=60889 RepID=A0AA40FKR5_9HYME|nr:hypothetical protein K0M31_010693 [Melipona bicolor]